MPGRGEHQEPRGYHHVARVRVEVSAGHINEPIGRGNLRRNDPPELEERGLHRRTVNMRVVGELEQEPCRPATSRAAIISAIGALKGGKDQPGYE
jgi:hypothetical protein